jgi:hypothetical protein
MYWLQRNFFRGESVKLQTLLLSEGKEKEEKMSVGKVKIG